MNTLQIGIRDTSPSNLHTWDSLRSAEYYNEIGSERAALAAILSWNTERAPLVLLQVAINRTNTCVLSGNF